MSTVEIPDVKALKETEKAVLCFIDEEEIWVPKSVIDEESEVQGENDDGTLVIQKWFALKNEALEPYAD